MIVGGADDGLVTPSENETVGLGRHAKKRRNGRGALRRMNELDRKSCVRVRRTRLGSHHRDKTGVLMH